MKGWKLAGAKIRNAFATPGKVVRTYTAKRAKDSYDKKSERLKGATSDRLIKIVGKAKNKMDKRSEALTTHTDRMEGRVKSVHERVDKRREEYIGELKTRKQAAEMRKSTREFLRSQGATRLEARRETKKIINELPVEHVQRIGTAAIVAETTRTNRARAERGEKSATARQERTGDRIKSTGEQIDNYDTALYNAQQSAVQISTELLPQANARVNSLSERAARFQPHELGFAEAIEAVREAQVDVARYKAELQYWRDASDRIREKANKADEHIGELHIEHDKRDKAATKATKQRKVSDITHDHDQAHLRQTLHDTLKPQGPEETKP